MSLSLLYSDMPSISDNETANAHEQDASGGAPSQPETLEEYIRKTVEAAVRPLLDRKSCELANKDMPCRERQGSESDDDDDDRDSEPALTDSESEGEELHPKVAEYLDTKLNEITPAEKLRVKIDRQKKPKNSKHALGVRVNPPIYKLMSKRLRAQDRALKRVSITALQLITNSQLCQYCCLINYMTLQAQELSAKAAIAASKVASSFVEQLAGGTKDGQTLAQEAYNDIFDAVTLASQSSLQINKHRVSVIPSFFKLVVCYQKRDSHKQLITITPLCETIHCYIMSYTIVSKLVLPLYTGTPTMIWLLIYIYL